MPLSTSEVADLLIFFAIGYLGITFIEESISHSTSSSAPPADQGIGLKSHEPIPVYREIQRSGDDFYVFNLNTILLICALIMCIMMIDLLVKIHNAMTMDIDVHLESHVDE